MPNTAIAKIAEVGDMSNTFTQRHGKKYGLYVKGFKRVAPEYSTKKDAYNWNNPIWRRERLRALRAGHKFREMVEENPNWLQDAYPNWDWRTDDKRRQDWMANQAKGCEQ
tara:strand:+ start:840 stop:1169 length:330 start_codon:yes stop_codon:yes gene_type:complete